MFNKYNDHFLRKIQDTVWKLISTNIEAAWWFEEYFLSDYRKWTTNILEIKEELLCTKK